MPPILTAVFLSLCVVILIHTMVPLTEDALYKSSKLSLLVQAQEHKAKTCPPYCLAEEVLTSCGLGQAPWSCQC